MLDVPQPMPSPLSRRHEPRHAAPAPAPWVRPWVRPGVVVHDPAEAVDTLLAGFASEIRARGFIVAGTVQHNHRGCASKGQGCAPEITWLDLASGDTVRVDRGHAVACLRETMRKPTDLLVISHFSACLDATDTLHARLSADAMHSLPLLTSIAGQCIHKWHSYARQDGAMLPPRPAALWAWWGPEHLYRDLALGVAAQEVRRIVCGPRWIMVEGPDGVGLAGLPRHPRDLLPRLPRLARQSLRDLAALSASWDPLDMALAVAAINAHCNRRDLQAASGNGVRRFRNVGGQVVVVGAFPGVDGILPNCALVEADPRPGVFPPAALDTLLPGCGAAVLNASVLANRSLPRLLRQARHRPVALVGPATPLTPRLHAYGLDLLAGLVVEDADGLATAIRAGAAAREFGRFGRFVHLAAGA
ncbi:conserved protein of unknown function [Rhodovastum atsumiense]|uniref:DUF2478 domain-containing protein n=1 Tax=Rhodovastum atsumiense TaxID=504468 RepID=A0A5M6IZU9_9PROT|nr:DUF364 domain-containing protein [Rhodovastum atsumiense]KAA5613874.1 DUF2478 domain-containing protein [Rhodovastum atsumiense]CAH2601996.1 conserved protein of unknown function [Rhodovastum atsumiense]